MFIFFRIFQKINMIKYVIMQTIINSMIRRQGCLQTTVKKNYTKGVPENNNCSSTKRKPTAKRT